MSETTADRTCLPCRTTGLDLYLKPYRVTATGPGCGAIHAIPNATSRNEMGRAKVNNLMDFFVDKYGNPDSNAFQKTRLASLHNSIPAAPAAEKEKEKKDKAVKVSAPAAPV
ncbi:hypothetical protein CF319_g9134, partial [Tilletia indica]